MIECLNATISIQAFLHSNILPLPTISPGFSAHSPSEGCQRQASQFNVLPGKWNADNGYGINKCQNNMGYSNPKTS
jgi:hypothetical protein